MEILIFIIGIISGFLGATVGSGGMITVPVLLFLGFPPNVAVATNKAGNIGCFLSAVKEYWKNKKIDWNIAIPLSAIMIIGSIIGTQIIVRLDTGFLEKLIAIVILIFLPFLFLSKKKKKKNWN